MTETTTEQLAEIEGQGESTPVTGYTPPEGWRVLKHGEVLQPGDQWVNWEGTESRPDIQHGYGATVSGGRYIRHVETERNAATIERLRSNVSSVRNLLSTEKRRVVELEELVMSLRTINEAQEKAFNAANKANDDLQHRLNVVATEWAEQTETIRGLQTKLDAAQQVPQAIADRFEEGWNQGTARAVETVIAWLEPIRLADSAYLANATMQHLPSIMRHLTGLAQD